MWPDMVSNPEPLTYESGALPTALRGPEGIEDNSKIIFLISQRKHKVCCDPSLEPSQRDNSNDGSQNMFLWKNMDNYPKVILVTPSYLEHCGAYTICYSSCMFLHITAI